MTAELSRLDVKIKKAEPMEKIYSSAVMEKDVPGDGNHRKEVEVGVSAEDVKITPAYRLSLHFTSTTLVIGFVTDTNFL